MYESVAMTKRKSCGEVAVSGGLTLVSILVTNQQQIKQWKWVTTNTDIDVLLDEGFDNNFEFTAVWSHFCQISALITRYSVRMFNLICMKKEGNFLHYVASPYVKAYS